ncbi:MAG: DUF1501 domain-containing protein [Planctomycetaceae bacterium]|nr:DUF1501 domain-containing protein [Planctomycetaceae bacterium]MBT6157654.1 DUF1501 domain-containing protein [Planctomycetaceae bacterium]MBT6483593.1 DUF1501 domain-containing protein [Planctomycetaceae bacterium]MBT6493087.1 DUF1501 domain-containing protein [Planctomycetaceae bacterium]
MNLTVNRNRRQFLWEAGGGLGGIALAGMLADDGLLAGTEETPLKTTTALHFSAKAKRVVQLFMAGAASHVDLFDYKPLLEKNHGEKSDFGEPIEAFQNGLGPWMKSPWKFQPYGQCGKPLSEVVAPLGDCVDDMAFIHNMVGKTGVHSQATYLQATGFQRPGFPGMGAWVSYGLGSMNENLPTFVVLPDHRGFASNGPKNWGAAFLPGQHQGTIIRPGTKTPIVDLFPQAQYVTDKSDKRSQDVLARLNRRHLDQHAGDDRLEARIRSYELAARMQLAAPDALDISKESKHTLKMYGLDHGRSSFGAEINPVEEADYFGRKCLAARRLLERGVRFVQIWSGNDNGFPRRNWDSHEDIKRDHGPLAMGMAVGASALLKDLKQRGMLEDTIVLWTTEFGRLPSSQGSKGRDHNPFVFSNWLAGGGIKGGTTHGESDQWGYKPLDRDHPTTVYDVHATILRQLGIDHKRLTMRHDGIDRRLTDVHGNVIREIIG